MLDTTARAWGSPGRYIQGPGEIRRLDIHTEKYGKRVFSVIDEFFFENYSRKLKTLYEEKGKTFDSFCYRAEITKEPIRKAAEKAEEFHAEVIVGIGGGKAIDTSKCVAARLNVPLIVIPTSASTDAPTSAMAIIYTHRSASWSPGWATRWPLPLKDAPACRQTAETISAARQAFTGRPGQLKS